MYPFLYILFGGIIISAAALYHGTVMRRYTINTDKIKNDQTLKIVLISDLHNSKHKNLIGLIRDMKPDLIALAGDIIDTRYPMKNVDKFLDEIAMLDIPVFYVTGNHEMGALGTGRLKNAIRRRGIIVLEDEFISIKINDTKLIIAGIDDPYRNDTRRWQKKISAKFTEIKKLDCYKILLAHRPDLWRLYSDMGFDLVLSGHAHGGQVRIPFLLNGLYAPHQGFFPKYAGGVYNHTRMNHVVSRGLAKFINLPRIFNPPEFVVITINHNIS